MLICVILVIFVTQININTCIDHLWFGDIKGNRPVKNCMFVGDDLTGALRVL